MRLANPNDLNVTQEPGIPVDPHRTMQDQSPTITTTDELFATIEHLIGIRLISRDDVSNNAMHSHIAQGDRGHKSCVGANFGGHNFCVCYADSECECGEE